VIGGGVWMIPGFFDLLSGQVFGLRFGPLLGLYGLLMFALGLILTVAGYCLRDNASGETGRSRFTLRGKLNSQKVNPQRQPLGSSWLVGILLLAVFVFFLTRAHDPAPGRPETSAPMPQPVVATTNTPELSAPKPEPQVPQPEPVPFPEEVARQEAEQQRVEAERKREAEALRLLNEARSWQANGRIDTARTKYEELIERYEGTKAATEAKPLLDAMMGK